MPGLDVINFPTIGNTRSLHAIILDTLHTMTNKTNSKLLGTLPYVVAAFGLLFTFIGLSEFYNVKIAGQESAYPFGPINENQ